MNIEFLEDFKREFGDAGRSGMDFMVSKRDDPQDQLLVVFPNTESVGVKEIRVYCEQMVSNDVKGAIIIYQKGLTPSASKVLQTMTAKYNLETFSEAELMVNITKHSLVPQHQVLTAEEKKSLLERYRLRETQLPRIQPSDPIARYYGLKKGQVVRITRPSETAGRYITYRICL